MPVHLYLFRFPVAVSWVSLCLHEGTSKIHRKVELKDRFMLVQKILKLWQSFLILHIFHVLFEDPPSARPVSHHLPRAMCVSQWTALVSTSCLSISIPPPTALGLLGLLFLVPLCFCVSISVSMSRFPRMSCLIPQTPVKTGLSWSPTPTEFSSPLQSCFPLAVPDSLKEIGTCL